MIITIFCNSTVKVTYCHFCHSLLNRRKSLELSPTQEEWITQGHETNEAKIIGIMSEMPTTNEIKRQ